MNPSKRFETRRETGQAKQHNRVPKVETVPPKVCFDEQTPPRKPAEPHAPDDGAFETFVDGAGI